MPEFRYYATMEESLAMLRDLFGRSDLRAIAKAYDLPKPSAPIHTALTDTLAKESRKNPNLRLFGDFSTHPPLFAKVDDTYVLSDGGGGPFVGLLLASVLERILVSGALWTQPHYELAGQRTWPSPEVKTAHADMVKVLKKHLLRWEGLWISPGALQLLKDGQAELPGDLKPLGVLARKAKLPTLSSPVVPQSSKKTTKRKVAAKTATP
jgi:hypothetical protein